MMHALLRRVTLLLALIFLLSSCMLLQVSAEESSVVYDYADEFTDEEIAEITAAARAKTAECGAQIVIVTTKTWGYDVEDFLRQHSDYSGDLILLIIINDLGTYYYDLDTCGRADSLIKGTEVDLILDDPDVFYNLKGGNLFDGTMAFVEVASKAYAERIAFPMKDVIVGSLVIALIIALVVCGIIIARYRMKLKPTNYPLDQYAKLKLNEQSDIFIGKHTLRRRIDSGGSRSGGGSRGGGHRGGR
jgi:uncharacterized membrane protein YgcG